MKLNFNEKMMRFKEGPPRETSLFLLTMFEIALEMKPEVILEIGIHNCISTHAWLSALAHNKKGKLYAIDVIDFAYNVVDEELRKYLEFTKADSREFYKTWDKEIDILHIDGDHSYETCKLDYENYYPFVKPGGFIFIHDVIHWQGVTKFWEEIEDEKIYLPFYDGMGIVQKNGLTPKDIAKTREHLAGKKYE